MTKQVQPNKHLSSLTTHHQFVASNNMNTISKRNDISQVVAASIDQSISVKEGTRGTSAMSMVIGLLFAGALPLLLIPCLGSLALNHIIELD
jgi:hypothetical protein